MASPEIRYEYPQKDGIAMSPFRYDSAPLMAGPADHRPPSGGNRRATIVEWIWEISSMVFSIVALLAIAGIAWKMDNRPLTDWYSAISINAVISAITVTSRATLAIPIIACIGQLKWMHFRSPRKVSDMEVFDNASRGGGGALMLIFKIPMNGAAVGALVTLLAYTLGPFYQQVIQLEQRDVPVPGNATGAAFAFAHEYRTTSRTTAGSRSIELQSVDTQMQGAMIAGLFGNQIGSNFNCSSAICNWSGPITTLGFHSECQNVTVATLATKICRARNGTVVDDSDFITSHNSTSKWTAFFLNGTLGTRLQSNIFTVVQYSVPRERVNGRFILGEDVQECTISVAAHTYSSVRASGNSLDVGRPVITSSQLFVNESRTNRDIPSETDTLFYSAPNIPVLKIKSFDLEAITTFLGQEFINKTIDFGPAAKGELGLNVAVSTRSLNESIADMTQRMTLRIAEGANRQIAVGTNTQSVVFVKSWYSMLVVPIVVTAITLMLLLCTMWTSRASTGTALWKSSALALLFHQMRPSDDPRMAVGMLHCDYGNLKELKRVTKDFKVQKVD